MTRSTRFLLICALAATVATSTGCSWFRGNKDAYLDSPQSRPLEVPPDLVLPNTAGALQVPGVSPTAGAADGVAAAPPASSAVAGFTLADTSDSAFRRVGIALPRITGVASAKPVQALGSYEVQFKGSDFLVKLEAAGEQTRVSAVSPDGTAITAGAAAELLGLLQARLQ